MELLKFDEQAYVHKLNAQELGYRNGKPHGAGRYFYVSKSCISYFPPLSEVVLNDHVLLDLIPPNADQVALTKYVYHNDKFAAAAQGDSPRRRRFKPGIDLLEEELRPLCSCGHTWLQHRIGNRLEYPDDMKTACFAYRCVCMKYIPDPKGRYNPFQEKNDLRQVPQPPEADPGE